MAILCSIQSGNFLDATTWAVADTTSAQLSAANNSFVPSLTPSGSSFSITAADYQGVALYVNNKNVGSGTLTVQLFNNTTSTIITTVTINVADIPSNNGQSSGGGNGWVYFKFATPVTLNVANTYSIRLASSVSNQIAMNRSAVSVVDWTRLLITTASQAPAATDSLYILGQRTAAGVSGSHTVIMNNTSSAVGYGAVNVSHLGELKCETSESKNYYLKLTGSLNVFTNGLFEMGNSTTPIPSSSTATLEIDSSAIAGQYNINVTSGTFRTHGSPKTSVCRLSGSVAVGATSSFTDVATGWKNGDSVVVTNTNIGGGRQTIVLAADAVGTLLPSHSAYTATTEGNAGSYVQAHMGNLTRNVVVKNTSVTNRGAYNFVIPTGVSTTNWSSSFTRHENIAKTSFTSVNRLMYSGSVHIQTGGSLSNAVTLDYVTNGSISDNVFVGNGTATGTPIFGSFDNNNLIVGNSGFAAAAGVFLGNGNAVANSSGHGWNGSISSLARNTDTYVNPGIGWYYTGGSNISVTGVRMWKNSNNNFSTNLGASNVRTSQITFTSCSIFGGVFPSVILPYFYRVVYNSCLFWGEGAGPSAIDVNTYNLGYTANASDTTYMNNCSFGFRPDGTISTYSSIFRPTQNANIVMFNCRFTGSETNYAFTGIVPTNSAMNFVSLNHNQVAGAYKLYQKHGTIETDTVRFRTAAPSLKMTPGVGVGSKVVTNNVQVAVKSGSTCNVSVAVRRSTVASGDAANYNGSAPRLMYVYNPMAGNLSETVGATATAAASGSFELLSYTTPAVINDSVLEFYVDCDGTTGFVSVDDWNTTTSTDTRALSFCGSLGTYTEVNYRTPGGNYTFAS